MYTDQSLTDDFCIHLNRTANGLSLTVYYVYAGAEYMKHFADTLRALRLENKLPQKDAAVALGVSQALLSHYEKGIRECGLDFVVRAAAFYGVSCDFLLGTSHDGEQGQDKAYSGNIYASIHKKAVQTAAGLLFDSMNSPAYKTLSSTLGQYFNLAFYCAIRTVFGSSPGFPYKFGDFGNDKEYRDALWSAFIASAMKLSAEQPAPLSMTMPDKQSEAVLKNILSSAEKYIK